VDDLADLVEVLVPPLQAGVATAEAVRTAASALGERPALGQLTRALATAASQGLPLGPVWADEPTRAPQPVQRFLARAWSLSEEAGVPLSVSLTAAGRVLRSRQAAERALAAATAGARASMTLLALLPVSGPAIGLLFGLTPIDLYAGSRAAAGSLAFGVVLGCTGWVWSRSILLRALQPEVVS
jgi:tight adherence protein B